MNGPERAPQIPTKSEVRWRIEQLYEKIYRLNARGLSGPGPGFSAVRMETVLSYWRAKKGA